SVATLAWAPACVAAILACSAARSAACFAFSKKLIVGPPCGDRPSRATAPTAVPPLPGAPVQPPRPARPPPDRPRVGDRPRTRRVGPARGEAATPRHRAPPGMPPGGRGRPCAPVRWDRGVVHREESPPGAWLAHAPRGRPAGAP